MLKLILLLIFLLGSAHAYDLFHPTPKTKLRGLNTDRPDKTESALTVDAGHFQIETDLVNWSEERGAPLSSSSLFVNNMNLKAGLTESSDLQLIIASYLEEIKKGFGQKSNKKGFGDTSLRYKYNFFGNDGGAVALGVMPYLKFPTAGAELSNGRVEGGIIFPVGLMLPSDWKLGLMAQVDNRRAETGGGRTDYITSAALGHPLYRDLSGFVEVFNRASDDALAGAVMTLDLGITYQMSDRIQWDTGAFFGLTEAADDINLFFGLSVLF